MIREQPSSPRAFDDGDPSFLFVTRYEIETEEIVVGSVADSDTLAKRAIATLSENFVAILQSVLTAIYARAQRSTVKLYRFTGFHSQSTEQGRMYVVCRE